MATKIAVYRGLPLGGPPEQILGDWIRLTYIHNAGAAFGLFQGNRFFFIGVSLLSSLVIVALAVSRRYREPWMMIAFGLILGGAVGNLLDRLWLGVVIDFIDVGIGSHRWPIFNVADMGVSVGVSMLALRLLREGSASHPSESAENPPETRGDLKERWAGTPEPDRAVEDRAGSGTQGTDAGGRGLSGG